MLEFIGERVLEIFYISSTYLVFNDNGIEILIAKVPVKTGISLDSLRVVDLVCGNTVLEISGKYSVHRVIRGNYGVIAGTHDVSCNGHTLLGWRPILFKLNLGNITCVS